jgi:uncharacterized membrane protein
LTRIEKSTEIKASPEKLWPMVSGDGWMKCYAPLKKIEYTSKEKNKVGATYHVITELAGLKGNYDCETTEVIENEKVGWRTTGGNFTEIGSIVLVPTRGGTEVTYTTDYELPYSILGKIIDKLRLHKALEKAIETGLNKLKEMMEK